MILPKNTRFFFQISNFLYGTGGYKTSSSLAKTRLFNLFSSDNPDSCWSNCAWWCGFRIKLSKELSWLFAERDRWAFNRLNPFAIRFIVELCAFELVVATELCCSFVITGLEWLLLSSRIPSFDEFSRSRSSMLRDSELWVSNFGWLDLFFSFVSSYWKGGA